MKNKGRVMLIGCGVTLITITILIAGLFLWGWIVSHRELTEIKPWGTYSTAMYLASRGCGDYKKQHGVWPDSFDQLRAFRGDINERCKDAWGRDFVFVPYNKSLGYGQIISYGRDGKPGGTGADHDLIVRFPCAANSNWNEQVGAGLKKPRFNP